MTSTPDSPPILGRVHLPRALPRKVRGSTLAGNGIVPIDDHALQLQRRRQCACDRK